MEKEGELCCTYCNKPRHTREKCWKLNAKPPSCERGGLPGGVSRKNSRAYVAEKAEENKTKSSNNSRLNSLNQEEIERMKAFLNSLEKPKGTCAHVCFQFHSGLMPQIYSLLPFGS